jgi:vacuolar-type H+-ATPase subunit I/STV1
MEIKQNIGKTDKWIRIISGIVLVGIGYYLQSWLLGIVGLIIFITGIIDWCLIYRLFGISTCKIEAQKETGEHVDETNTQK